MMIGDLQVFSEEAFSRKSRQLDLLSRGDFTPIASELAAAYPDTNLPVRAIPFVMRYVAELSGLYARPVVRRFKAGQIADATWQTLQAAYAASAVDDALYEVEQALWHQNTVLLLVQPTGLGKVRVIPVLPWQIELVEMDEPLAAGDPASWTKVHLQVPTQVVNNSVIFGRMELTRTEAWRFRGAQRVGVYQPNGGHPFGKVPLIIAHRVRPDPGRACAPVNEAVLNLQIAVSLQAADNELIIRHCAWPQKVIEGGDTNQQAEEVSLGPDKVYSLPRSGEPGAPNATLRVVQGQVPVSELVAHSEHQVRMYCAMLGLDPTSFIRVNTSVTAAARLFQAQDRQAQRDKILPVLAKLETDLLAMIVAVLQLGQPLPVPPDLGVEATYQFFEPSPDPVADGQRREADIKVGATSASLEVAKDKGISRSEALKLVKANLAESRELGLVSSMTPAAAADGAATSAPTAGVVADTAMNVAQVSSLVDIIGKVAAGQLPAVAAEQVIIAAFPTLVPEKVRAMVNAAAVFTPAVSQPGTTSGAEGAVA